MPKILWHSSSSTIPADLQCSFWWQQAMSNLIKGWWCYVTNHYCLFCIGGSFVVVADETKSRAWASACFAELMLTCYSDLFNFETAVVKVAWLYQTASQWGLVCTWLLILLTEVISIPLFLSLIQHLVSWKFSSNLSYTWCVCCRGVVHIHL